MEKKTFYITFDVYENGYVDTHMPKDIPVKLADEIDSILKKHFRED